MNSVVKTVAVVDYGMGNLRSVTNAVMAAALGAGVEVVWTQRPEEVMAAYGYYDGAVSSNLVDGGASASVTLTIDQGPLYKIGRFDIVWQGGKPATPVLAFATGLPASPGAVFTWTNVSSSGWSRTSAAPRRTAGWTMLHIDSWEMGAQNWTARYREE